jgi:hypothetical protein
LDEHVRRFEAIASNKWPAANLEPWIAQEAAAVADAREVTNSAIEEWNTFYSVAMFGQARVPMWLWPLFAILLWVELISKW